MMLFGRRNAPPETVPPSFAVDPVAFVLWSLKHERDISVKAFQKNLEKRSLEYVSRNLDSISRITLGAASVLWRAAEKSDVAQAAIDEVLPFGRKFCDVVESAGADEWFHSLNLVHSLLLVQYSSDFEISSRLASAAFSRRAQEEGGGKESGGVFDEIVKMLASTILDEREKFEAAKRRFQRDRSVQLVFRTYFPYDEMMQTIIDRNPNGFLKVANEAKILFAARKTDKTLTGGSLLDGFGKDNDVVVDVWSGALARCAKSKGLDITL